MTNLQPMDPSVSVNSLIPHRPPMQLLDRVLAAGPEHLWACAKVSKHMPLAGAAGVPGCIGLEYLGQAAAAFFSARALHTNNAGNSRPPTPKPGMLIGSRSYSCQKGHFPLESMLLIEVAPSSAVAESGLVKFYGTIYCLPSIPDDLSMLEALVKGTQPFAEGDLSVYLPGPTQLSKKQPPDNQ